MHTFTVVHYGRTYLGYGKQGKLFRNAPHCGKSIIGIWQRSFSGWLYFNPKKAKSCFRRSCKVLLSYKKDEVYTECARNLDRSKQVEYLKNTFDPF